MEDLSTGGGKIHHLQMEGEMWYKRKDKERLKALGDKSLRIISIKYKTSTLRFRDICADYMSASD